MDEQSAYKMIKNKKKKKIALIILHIILILLLGASIYASITYYKKYTQLVKSPDSLAKEEVKNITREVGKLYNLPPDEEPTVATVLDKDKLKDQDFFKNTENGDKVIVYAKAKKAILYRPSTNKLVEVGPVIYGSDGQSVSTTTTAASKK